MHLRQRIAAHPGNPPDGFTLIELLVVIAVIAILASLIMPAILSSMNSALSSKCTSNLRQFGQALPSYLKDYAMFLPAAGAPVYPPFTVGCDYWYVAFAPYLPDHGVFKCPAKNVDLGYGHNYRFPAKPRSNWSKVLWRKTRPMSDIRKPPATIFICDAGTVVNKDDTANLWEEGVRNIDRPPHGPSASNIDGYVRFPGDPNWDIIPVFPVPRHMNAKTNCLFFDGHIESHPTVDLVGCELGDTKCLYDNE